MERTARIQYDNGRQATVTVEGEYIAWFDGRFTQGESIPMPALGITYLGWKDGEA